MKCPKCSFEVNKKDKFCPYCGHNLKEVVDEVVDEEIEEVEEQKLDEEVEEENQDPCLEGYEKDDIEKNKIYSVFSYLSFLFIIPLIACPNSKYAKFHVNQGIILCILNVLFSALMKLFEYLSNTIFFDITETGLDVCILMLTIYGIYNAATGKVKKLPVIGNINILK